MIERRRRRSSDPQHALTLLLEAIATRLGLRSLALADERGMLLAGIGDDTVALARAGRCAALGEDDPGFEAAGDLYGARVEVGAATFFLGSLGARVRRVHEARASIARILRVA